jgi:ribosomal protein S18 acetylase RimI-like enzyme
MKDSDSNGVARIYLQCFRGMKKLKSVKKWITLRHKSFPVSQYFVAVLHDKIVGYIQWVELGGFRKEAVIELEQVAVSPDHQGKGIGNRLVTESLKEVSLHIRKRGSSIKLAKVTTGTSNEAQKLYGKALNARKVAIIPDFFRSDEVVMIARRNDLPL